MYSALVDDNITISCFFKHQLIDPLLSMKMKLKVNFWLSLSFVQFKFKYSSTKSLP